MSMRDAPSNYPDGMTAADHAYLDGDHPPCEHESWVIDTSSNPVEEYFNDSEAEGTIMLRVICEDCNTIGYVEYEAKFREVVFDV
tara:strand:- start:1197 stop:1451 length:255 start_codon:yes stop_codon:yes gene_type:complete